ncbi:GGDEF domain-containing protein [Vibrio salinus]|uniref:GGDEF domain-containing protein n=1 Tax=Vibrio salinus TaxID=2899784 RepID=UPI001E511DF7|nr:GGDEF domain-containing protein [Vibrio salinus]MCE0495819.1 GGDEF domain-containing protein [Vibrio salinus]
MSAFTSWFRFIFPILVAITVSTVLVKAQEAMPFTRDSIAILPYIFNAIILILALMFKRSRIAMLALANVAAYAIIQSRLQTPLSLGSTFLEYCLLVFLYPVALYLIYLFKNANVLTKGTLYYLFILSLLAGWSAVIIENYQELQLVETFKTLLYYYASFSRLPVLLFLYLFALLGISAIMHLNYGKQINTAIYTSMTFFVTMAVLFDTRLISSTLFSIEALFQITYMVLHIRTVAYKDKLTDLASRRALELEFMQLNRRYSVAMIDVDHFKKFNDKFGHDAGDDVLRLVGTHLKSHCKKAQVYRYGGEEFTVIYKGKLANDAKENLEELREAISNYEMKIRNPDTRPKINTFGALKRSNTNLEYQTVKVTISIGVSDSSLASSSDEVLKLADEALYEAKQKGRNRVVVSH